MKKEFVIGYEGVLYKEILGLYASIEVYIKTELLSNYINWYFRAKYNKGNRSGIERRTLDY